MLKLFKMLQQIVSQLEQICCKLGLKNDYTLAVSNFTRQFVPQKWAGAGKGVYRLPLYSHEYVFPSNADGFIFHLYK